MSEYIDPKKILGRLIEYKRRDKTPAEMVAEVRHGEIINTLFGLSAYGHKLTDEEAARELEAWADDRERHISAPTPTAEELVSEIRNRCYTHSSGGDYSDRSEFDDDEAINIVSSALAQAKAEARREAADEFCAACPGVCQYKNAWGSCPTRAAILGHGEGR